MWHGGEDRAQSFGRKRPSLIGPVRGFDGRARGFSLIDVLVSMGVIAVLIGIMVPSLSSARENANRVVCASNVRQMGLGLQMYADDNRGFLPESVFLRSNNKAGDDSEAEEMMVLRLSPYSRRETAQDGWDGLGLLYSHAYLLAPKLFYCPSHKGDHPFLKYQAAWSSTPDEIVSNYHFRGEGPNGARQLDRIEPTTSALLTDGMRTLSDYNHRVGSNVLRADLAVRWRADEGDISSRLPGGVRGGDNNGQLKDIWRSLDEDPN